MLELISYKIITYWIFSVDSLTQVFLENEYVKPVNLYLTRYLEYKQQGKSPSPS